LEKLPKKQKGGTWIVPALSGAAIGSLITGYGVKKYYAKSPEPVNVQQMSPVNNLPLN